MIWLFVYDSRRRGCLRTSGVRDDPVPAMCAGCMGLVLAVSRFPAFVCDTCRGRAWMFIVHTVRGMLEVTVPGTARGIMVMPRNQSGSFREYRLPRNPRPYSGIPVPDCGPERRQDPRSHGCRQCPDRQHPMAIPSVLRRTGRVQDRS